MTDRTLLEKTGCNWERWVHVLDYHGAEDMRHGEIAAFIRQKYKVDGWWSQMVTVGYERIKRRRSLGQRLDGSYEASKSKTYEMPVEKLFDAWADARRRKRWLTHAPVTLRTAIPPKSLRLGWRRHDRGRLVHPERRGQGFSRRRAHEAREQGRRGPIEAVLVGTAGCARRVAVAPAARATARRRETAGHTRVVMLARSFDVGASSSPLLAAHIRLNAGTPELGWPPGVTFRRSDSSYPWKEDEMLKWLMHRGTAAFERQWNYDASYAHELIDIDPRAAWMFQRATGLGKYRKDVPAEVLAAAAITAVRSEDCGPCTQLGVTMAERAGLDPNVLRAVLTETPQTMPPDVALAWRFTRATLDHDPSADRYRAEIIKRWGPRAVVSLAFAILTARMYPTVKYAMGHGQACSRIVVGGAPISFGNAASAAHHG